MKLPGFTENIPGDCYGPMEEKKKKSPYRRGTREKKMWSYGLTGKKRKISPYVWERAQPANRVTLTKVTTKVSHYVSH